MQSECSFRINITKLLFYSLVQIIPMSHNIRHNHFLFLSYDINSGGPRI
jgi:hypothetical protein